MKTTTDINHNDPLLISLRLLEALNKLAETATNLDLTGDVKYTYSGCSASEWDAAFPYLQEACQVKRYGIVRHIVEVKRGFNVYLLLD